MLIWVAVLLFSVHVNAQEAGTGNIQGTITDPTGSVVPNAALTLTEASTLVQHKTQSDSRGVYAFTNMVPGTYSLDVTAPGFQRYLSTGNVLEVGSSIAINVAMTVGTVNQQVEVKTDTMALQTEDPSFKQTIDQHAITEMPLNGRQLTSLLTFSGGSAPAAGNDFTGSKYSYQTIAISVTGGMGNSTLWRLDGGDNNDYMGNGNLPFPFPDAVGQFSVESTALGAQDGMHEGGMVNMVTRSGTNLFHGTAFEFIRNNLIDATNFYVIPPNGPGQREGQVAPKSVWRHFRRSSPHPKIVQWPGQALFLRRISVPREQVGHRQHDFSCAHRGEPGRRFFGDCAAAGLDHHVEFVCTEDRAAVGSANRRDATGQQVRRRSHVERAGACVGKIPAADQSERGHRQLRGGAIRHSF